MQQLSATVWQSAAVKLGIFTIGLVLYMVPPHVYLPEGWPVRMGQKFRPMTVCYATLLPFLSMYILTSIFSTVRRKDSWVINWSNSGWRMVPIPRPVIQRALLIDMMGFAAASSIP